MCQLIEKLQSYLEDTGSRSEICRVYLRRIEHFYYKVELSEMRNAQKKRAEVKKGGLKASRLVTLSLLC